MEKAEKRKMKRMVNKEKGKAGIKVAKKTNADKVMMDPPVSVLFVDNTKSGTLVRKLRERAQVMKELTGFGIKFQEAGGSQLRNSFSLELVK